MLRELWMKNFLLFRELHLSLDESFIVFTGETGAGKSMFLEGLRFLFGFASSQDFLGPFGEETEVAALVELPPHLESAFEEMGIPVDEGEISLRRVIRRDSKRSKSYVNGVPLSVRVLKSLGSQLFEVHSQRDSRLLYSVEFHRDVVDYFSHAFVLRQEYEQVYREWQKLEREIQKMEEEEKQRKERLEFLQFQLREIEAACLERGEKQKLLERYELLSKSAEMKERMEKWRQVLIEKEGALIEVLGRCQRDFEEFVSLDPRFQEILDGTEQAKILVDHIGRLLLELSESALWEPEELSFLEERLKVWESLERKYHREGDALLDYLEELRKEVKESENWEVRKEEKIRERERLWALLQELGKKLSEKRKEGKQKLEELVEKELKDLGMPWVKLEIQIQPLEKLGPKGGDRVEFWLSPNPGMPLKPLREIGSGGEVSRITLALKKILSECYQVPILFFDEVDTGVGGRLGHVLGKKLRELSQHHQVFCITHLPQLAAFSELHYRIYKEVHKGQTEAKIELLSGEERKRELALMLRGAELTEVTLKEAEDLMEKAREESHG